MASDTVKIIQCPKCKKMSLECRYVENGGPTAFVDNFYHQCTNPACGFVAKEENVWAGAVSYESDWPNCPFCGRLCYP